MDLGPLLVAHAQPPELIQPSEGAFHHTAPSAQPAAMCGVALRQKRDDVSATQTFPDGLGVITAVA
jgi:hypothetical protein